MSTQVAEIDNRRELLKQTICKGASDQEFELFAHICKRTGLDPFAKQVFPVFRWDSKQGRNLMTVQTSIDGYRVIAERTGNYAPGKEIVYSYNTEGTLISATAYVKKLTKDGAWHEVAATAFWDEYAQKTKEGKLSQFWSKMPHLMLGKCAESLALRKAFPAELSGLYTHEEMNNSVTMEQEIVEEPEPTLNQEQIDEILELIGEDIDLLGRITKGYGVKSVHEIAQKHYPPIVKNLTKRLESVS